MKRRLIFRYAALAAAAALCIFSFFILPNDGALTATPHPGTLVTQGEGLWREQLDEQEAILYDTMLGALLAHEPTVTVANVAYTDEMVSRAAEFLKRDYPTLFYADFPGFCYMMDASGLTVSFTYLYNAQDAAAKGEELLARAQQLADAAQTHSDNFYEQALFVHDAIITSCSYDLSLASTDCHNAYGALVAGSAVCDGYALGYQYVMSLLGADCWTVSGTALDAEGMLVPHAWNLLRMEDGSCSYIDVTWDDMDYDSGRRAVIDDSVISRCFFGLSPDVLAYDHVLDSYGALLPEAVSHSYYEQRGIHCTEVTDEIIRACAQQLVDSLTADGETGFFELAITDKDALSVFCSERSGSGLSEVLREAEKLLKADSSDIGIDRTVRYFVRSSERGVLLVVCEAR